MSDLFTKIGPEMVPAIPRPESILGRHVSPKATAPPRRIQDAFPIPPVDGIHGWVMDAAWHCRKAGMTASEAVAKIRSFEGSLRRPFQHHEAEEAVEKVYSTKIEKGAKIDRIPELPPWNARETARIHQTLGLTTGDLVAESPEDDPAGIHPRGIITMLFPDPDGLICIGKSMSIFSTDPLAAHRHLRSSQFIVPAYMLATWGKTQAGKESQHTKENTGPRRFIVLDFDSPPPEQHPSIIHHLAKFRPLVMALKSGGKSLHAWFPTTTSVEDDRLFWRLGISLGADPALFRNPSQFVRIPNGTRNTRAKQEVVYFNPAASQ